MAAGNNWANAVRETDYEHFRPELHIKIGSEMHVKCSREQTISAGFQLGQR